MSLGGSAPAGASTNQPRAGASVYTPTAQGPGDVQFQSVTSGLLGALGPAFQNVTGFPSNQDANAFASTPGGQAYQAAQPWLGAGSITDYTNPYYQQALDATAIAGGFAPQVTDIAGNVASTLPTAYGLANTAAQPAIAGMTNAINYGYGSAIPNAIAQAQNLENLFPNYQAGLANLLQSEMPIAQGLSGQLLGSAGSGIGQLFPQALTGGANLMGAGQDILSQTLPQALGASAQTTDVADWLQQNLGPLIGGTGENLISAGTNALNTSMPLAVGGALDLSKYAGDILQTGFDPQQALYDRTQNQVAQQAAAQAAQAGLGGTAYGASVDANALGNFNINWQNAQEARQAQALGAAAPAYTTAAGLPGQAAASAVPSLQAGAQMPSTFAQSLLPLRQAAAQLPGMAATSAVAPMQAGAGLPGATLSSFDQPIATGAQLPGGVLAQGGAIGQQIAALTQAAGALPLNLASGYGSLGGQADQLSYAPLQGYAGMGAQIAPLASQGATLGTGLYNLGAQGTSNALQTLGSGANLGTQQFVLPQQVLQDIESYLGLGQSASQLSGYLGNLGLQQQQNAFSGLGSALGTGSNLLFGSSPFGSSGLLGNPFSSSSGGLLGGLLGGGAGAGASGLASAADVAAAGLPAGSYFAPLAGTLGGDAVFGGGGAAAGGGGLGGLLAGLGAPFGS